MNSAMMPESGTYKCKYVDIDTFVKSFKKAYAKVKSFENSIGYPDTASFLSKILGVEVPMNRTNTSLVSGDMIWVVRKAQRFEDPTMKGVKEVDPSDYVYAVIEFK